jgi:hypothetical protein
VLRDGERIMIGAAPGADIVRRAATELDLVEKYLRTVASMHLGPNAEPANAGGKRTLQRSLN